jgi:uridylate kinase
LEDSAKVGATDGTGLSELGPVKRIVLKLSGESLAGENGYGIDPASLDWTASSVAEAVEAGAEMAVVVGGGNIFRGSHVAAELGIEGATADYMSMLGTVINAMALQAALESRGVETRVQTAIEIQEVAEPYIRRRAMRHLEKGRVVIFAAGTGNPFFTTDTAAALRALEIHAEAILMAKNGVEGVYSGDPRTDPSAIFIPEISHMEALQRGLKVMDATALALCMDHQLPLYVFNMDDEENIHRIVCGERVGTLVATT